MDEKHEEKTKEIKKGKSKKKVILYAILAILIIFILITVRKFIILTKLVEVSKNHHEGVTNYYAELNTYNDNDNQISIRKSYNKDGKYLTIAKTYGENAIKNQGITLYKDDNEKLILMTSGENKIYFNEKEENDFGKIYLYDYVYDDCGVRNRLIMSILPNVSISTEVLNDKECYVIKIDTWKRYFDKKTGLLIRDVNSGYVTDRKYELNTVTDEQVQKPDLTGYILAK